MRQKESKMNTVKGYVVETWKWWLVAALVATLGVSLLSAGGCSTVSGIAKDIGAMSDITKKAMAKD